jgi:subtilisin family serine protease
MNMKRIFAINLLLIFAIASLSSSTDAAVVDDMPDIPSLIGYAPNRIVVKFDPLVRQKMDKGAFSRGRTGILALDQVGVRHGVSRIRSQFPGAKKKIYKGRVIDLAGWHKVKFSGKVDVMAAVKEYKAMPGVIDAQPVSIHAVYQDPNDQFYDTLYNSDGISQWHLPKINAPQAWDIEAGNPNIIVAILDTGVRHFQKDLGGVNASYNSPTEVDGNMWVNWAEKGGIAGVDDDNNGYIDDWIGWDFIETTDDSMFLYCYPEDFLALGEEGEDCGVEDNDPRDFHGHGTHCAGNVSAMNNNGEAVASVAGGWGDGGLIQSGDGVKVMSLRIGWSAIYLGLVEVGVVAMDYAAEALYYASNNGATIASCSWGSENTGGIQDAIDYFLASGGLIFKAAGNDGIDNADYMAGREDVITVAATDHNDCKAEFSNYGTWVDISAPGVEIWSLFHFHYDPPQDYVTAMDGTSMSTPLAAGVAALIWSQNPGWSAEQVKQTLYDTADEIDSLACNSSYAGKLGAGRINAYQAVLAEPSSPPVAEFTATPTSGNTPLIVSFTDQSTGTIDSYSWDFGDGGTSNQQNPSHTYLAAETYAVSLSVQGPHGVDTETKMNFVNVTTTQPEVRVESLYTGRYETTGKGRNKTTSFAQVSSFNQGDEVVIRAYVTDTTGQHLRNAVVDIAITGPEITNLITEPSDGNGEAEAKWKTSAPKGKKKRQVGSTSSGTYTATVTNVTASGYTWDGAGTSTTFHIQ